MKLLLSFSRKGKADPGREPVIARVVKETGVLINVEKANIDSMAGEVLIDVPDRDADLVRRRLEEMGVAVHVMENAITLDEAECVDCGACISVCPQEVFSFDEEWRLRVIAERCVLCGKCIRACPHGALSQQG
ncbi:MULTISPECIES: 4Fe-4S binding protein [unclassified Methanoculleus]|uniref:4Fe-4S binding protein n=1 Tax=unclassified Methanoculleus TaxID=2619537 RepID=UPI0025D077DD|nr:MULTISPECIES: 4Fe-4S binding protein [unclassified Methanoculleus]MCK9318476.1 4Fe-4S binding protein [Methanoculleus sp.]MDD2254340.1 4Fe-4S binding protein [Methanoculleus sp.]MDD2788006.1 4Fe-4S binding protein [Methanoculleus sp.]MDD3216725.1 4Fe-4S binding protein [Methanoculleus sp.]MDD4313594.1 4Fe-4S binding protein [Methanoculleus sp.]